jgi:hypothetical protein
MQMTSPGAQTMCTGGWQAGELLAWRRALTGRFVNLRKTRSARPSLPVLEKN